MTCPECGEPTKFILHTHESREPHGEVFTDQWWECGRCKAQFTDAELPNV